MGPWMYVRVAAANAAGYGLYQVRLDVACSWFSMYAWMEISGRLECGARACTCACE